MIFTDDTVVMTRSQLVALVEQIYSNDDRPGIGSLFVDPKGRRVAATNGHTALVAAPDEQTARSKRTDAAFAVARSHLVGALKLNTRPTTAFALYLDDDETVISIIPSAITNGSFRESLVKHPRETARARDRLKHSGDDQLHERVSGTSYGFPPIENVIPRFSDREPTAVGCWSCGSDYLAQVASIGRAVGWRMAGGAIARLHPPTRSAGEPMVITLEDRDFSVFWIYVVMPVKL